MGNPANDNAVWAYLGPDNVAILCSRKLRSQYALRLFSWAKKYVKDGTTSISLQDLRKVLGLESIKDAEGNVIQEPPLPIWANFRQRALHVAIEEINRKTDLHVELKSIARTKHRRVTGLNFAIKAQEAPKRWLK